MRIGHFEPLDRTAVSATMVDERSGSGDVPWQTSSTDEPRSWTVGAYRDRGQPTLGHDRGDARARLVAD